MKKIFFFLFFMCFFCVQSKADGTSFEAERVQLLNQLHDVFCNGSAVAPLENFQQDGTWNDVDYDDKTRGDTWSPMVHLSRMVALASSHPDLAVKALEAWAEKDPSSTNWWWGCIGTPEHLCRTILIVRRENVPDELLNKLEPIIRRTYVYWPETHEKQTGQNLVWVEGIRFFTGLLFDDLELVHEGREVILSELKIVPPGAEGLQDDFSFHQHGSQNQIGNYGLSFLEDQVRWATALAGTSLAYPAEKIALLDRFFMDSVRWALMDGVMEYSSCGRQLFSGAPRAKYLRAVGIARRLMALVPEERAAEYRNWLDNPSRLFGAAVFPRSGCLMYHSPNGWNFSLKMCSSKIKASETVNSENMQGRYQGDGVTFFGNMGRYDGYPALFNQRCLPGTTEIQDDSTLWCCDIRNTNGYFAVLSHFPVAIAAMRMEASDIQADKVWFCTSAGVICSGSDIHSDSDAPVMTILDQFRADSEHAFPVDYSGNIAARRQDSRQVDWKDSFGEFPSKKISGDVVTLFINHGVKPEGAVYWYAMHKHNSIALTVQRLETSSPRIHAILADGYVLTAAFVPGSAKLQKTTITVEPGIAVWTPEGNCIKKAEFRTR